jgi:hypothetical protein
VEKARPDEWHQSRQEKESFCVDRGAAITFAQAFKQGLDVYEENFVTFASYDFLARRDDWNSGFFCCMRAMIWAHIWNGMRFRKMDPEGI